MDTYTLTTLVYDSPTTYQNVLHITCMCIYFTP